MQRRPRNVIAVAWLELFGGAEHGQQDAEGGFPRLGFAFDDAAVVADDLGNQRQAKPAPRGLGGDKGIEQVGQQVLGHTWAVVLDAEFQWQRYPRFFSWHREAHAWPEGGRQVYLRVAAQVDHGLGRVLDQVEEHLNQLVL